MIDAFVESRYVMFIKYAAVQLQQLGLRKQMDIFKDKPEAGAAAALALEQQKSDAAVGGESEKKSDSCCEKGEGGEIDSNKKDEGKAKMEEEEAKKIVESITDSITNSAGPGGKKDIEDSTRDIVKKAALAVGSLKETEFDIRFNPDVFSPGVKHKDGDGDFFKKQCQLVKDASDFLLTVQVPAFIRSGQ